MTPQPSPHRRLSFAPSTPVPTPVRPAALLLTAVLTAVLAGCGTALPPAPPAFPLATPQPVVDRYFGHAVADPYRALEDTAAEPTRRWMRAAAAHAEATLARLPGRDALRARIAELETGAPFTIGRVLRLPGEGGERYVYERREAGAEQFSLVLRPQGLRGPERVLVDPQQLSRAQGGAPVAVNHFSLSPDGRVLAYGVSARGSEAATLHRLDVATLQPLGEPVTRADFGVARWAPDGRHFAMTRLRDSSADPKAKYEGSAAWLLPADGAWAQAREILGPQTRSVTVQPSEIPSVLFTDDGRWLIGFLSDGVRQEVRLVVAPAASLAQGEPAWRAVIEPADKIVDFAYGNGTLYAATHAGAPRYRIVAAPIERFSAATAATVVPASSRVLGAMVAVRDGVYFEARDGNAKQLWRLPYGSGQTAHPVALPLQGSFALPQGDGLGGAHARLDGVLIALEDFAHARRLYTVSAAAPAADTGLQPPGRFDAPADVVTTEVQVPSHDGASVPMSIVHRRGLARDGSHPTLLLGYAAYGFTWEPRFNASWLAWLERGGVIAVANPRGSGVFGQDWYEAGKGPTKPNTWRDMIAGAEFLVRQGYASPRTLAIEGGSAGGITSGRAATERPDLFAAVVPRVGLLDTVRAELEPNGRPNIPEFGSHATEAGFLALRAMSTYHHIADGVRYPAVLLMHGVNDPRVAVWHSLKTAARFAAVSAGVDGGRPVLLRLDDDAGHGVGATARQRQQERADIFAFLLWQMGQPGFQPPAP